MSDEKPRGLADILAQLARDVENKPEVKEPEPDVDVSDEPRPKGLADLIADPMSRPFGWQTEAPDGIFTRGDPVGGSADLDRILALPRRTPFSELSDDTKEAVVEIEMAKYAKYNENCACKEIDPRKQCLKRLNHAQAWMLREISIAQGLLAHASVGIGKCVDPSTEVMDYSAGRRRLVHEVGALNVATFDKTLAVAPATAFPSGSKPCVEVSLRDGSRLKLSTDHPVLTARGWIHATELQTSDYAAVAIEMPEPANPIIASDDEVKFVAYMLSDGGCSQNTMSFTNMSPNVIDDWQHATRALGYEISERVSKSKAREFSALRGRKRNESGPGHYIHVEDPVRDRWELYGLAREKRAHADVWGLPRRQVALFLNRFWACDGHVAKTNLEITLASEKLVDDLRFLLTRLGVRSNKNWKKSSYTKDGERCEFDAWRLTISGTDALKFLHEVGDVLGKEEACQKLRTHLESRERNTNYDVVPVGPREFLEICDELFGPAKTGFASSGESPRTEARKFLHVTDGQFISRSKFLAFCERWSYCGKYSHLATTDVAWERVASVEDIGVREVYDLNVPGTHNFVANGVVIHNTMIDVLAAMALNNVRTVLLLIPASLRQQIQYDYLMINEHFHVPNIRLHYGDERPVVKLPAWDPARPTLHVLPYSRLSLPEESDFISRLNPDAIISDECDAIRSMGAARGRRIAKWYAGGVTPEEKRRRQQTKFLGWTGSLTDHSICEFNFLSLFALKDRSPLPLNPETVEQWASCLDATNNPAPPGELLRLCNPGEDVRHAFRRRLAETQGFIIANQTSIEVTGGEGTVELEIRERPMGELPQKVVDALKSVREGKRPDYLIPEADATYSEELSDAMAIARCAQEVSCGVLYYWKFPRGEPDTLIKEWKGRRKDYFSEVREQALLGITHLDSALLCEQAAMRFWGQLEERDDRPKWKCHSWPAWLEIRDQVEPQPASMVIDDFLARDVLEWAEDGPGIIWYTMKALALKIRELSGLPVHDGGTKGEQKLRAETGDRSIICSIQSNARGRDGLQHIFDRQLVVNPPASATGWEQLLGRAHRRGQRSAVVTTDVYAHTPELKKAVAQAMRRSEYVRDILGAEQKLLAGWKG